MTQKQLDKLIAEQVEKSRQEFVANLQTELINKQITLTSLQNQINPHFLYNALESLRGRAILDNAPAIADMAQALARYFRYNISSKSDIVTIREELDNIGNYMKIQQFRFNNRFHIDIRHDPDDDVLDAIIPKLTLQPILENSIHHGFERKLGDANIRIEIVRTRKNINILISDNGIGISKEKLKMLNERIEHFDLLKQEENQHLGLALPNINKRLKLLFGDEYGLHVSSIEGVGTDVELHIPYVINNR
ncbi:sensor histidine kinase [Cohnella laeviribosi]|uniref:sensor histidine kinase n=1 Tax=Cohnella laeviribosi TaxID=380174 RepID=UPI00146A4A69|nr:histidine kinase [Cohnella laeviribosi]